MILVIKRADYVASSIQLKILGILLDLFWIGLNGINT